MKPTKEEKSYQEIENEALAEFEEKFVEDRGRYVEPIFKDAVGSVGPIKNFLKSHLKEAYEAGKEDNENIATPQYKKDMQDAYEDGIAEERERIRKWAEKEWKYSFDWDTEVILIDDLLQELTK
jgi:hypothetical protein